MSKKLVYIDKETDFFNAEIILNHNHNDTIIRLNDYSNKEMFLNALHEELNNNDNVTFSSINIPECFLEKNEGSINIHEKFWDFLYALTQASEQDAFIAYLSHYNCYDYVDNIDFEDAVNSFNDKYYGCWESKIDFAENLICDIYDLDNLLGGLAIYFDYESFAHDLFINDYDFVEDCYVFSTH